MTYHILQLLTHKADNSHIGNKIHIPNLAEIIIASLKPLILDTQLIVFAAYDHVVLAVQGHTHVNLR